MIPSLASDRRRVLIVDESSENRDVLRTVLERRGVQCLEASGPDRGLEMARQHHPDLIVLDLASDAAPWHQAYEAASDHENSALVVLGSISPATPDPPHRRVVPKPYHYGPLIRTIEKLLQSSRTA